MLDKRAAELLTTCEALNAPIKLDVIAHRLGLSLEYASLGDDVSGLLVIEDRRAIIGVNKDHPVARQRFTIAHEIGHFLLHSSDSELFIDKKYNAVYRDKKSSTGQDRMEIQANRFAAALLMPKVLLEAKINEEEIDLGDDLAIETLAEKFEVSLQALIFRLSSLQFFEQLQEGD